MADARRRARLRGTIQAAQKTRIKTARAKRNLAIVKEKLDLGTRKDERSVNEQASEQVNAFASEARTTVLRTTQNAKYIQHKAARAGLHSGTATISNPIEIARRQQVQKAKQTTQQTTKMARRAKIRRRAAVAARSASKTAAAESRAFLALLSGGGVISLLIVVAIVLFGCGIALFGGGGNNDYTPVGAEVEAYDPMIRLYASRHGIGEFVDLIKAVMMQESGGRGRDPMQASECGYNTRFPREPNGITDPEYSINVGVQELAACLRLAGVDSPVDMERIRLAIQGYNFGEGYITWAKSRYGGYSIVNAMEYSTMMAERNHWDSYGDQNYVNHVLRYYPFGHAFLPGSGQALVEVARSQLGNVGGEPYWSWYGFPERVEWCACFVSWCANQCGLIESGAAPKFSYCDDGIEWYQLHNQWKGREYTPQPGDYIFFDWDRDGHANHVGIVECYENGIVYTIEGNSSDKCVQHQYNAIYSNIVGYGRNIIFTGIAE